MANGNEPVTRIDQLNQLVRAYCVIILITGFVFVFILGLWQKATIISSDTYVAVLSGITVWWFKSKDEEKSQETAKEVAQVSKEMVSDVADKVKEASLATPTGGAK